MNRWVHLGLEPIDEAALVRTRSPSCRSGAIVCFSGVVRGTEGIALIEGINYEAFSEMAEHQLHQLLDQLEGRWPIESVRLIHRVGRVPAGEASLWVELSAPHRAEAFQAIQWLINELKRVVPVWKHPYPSEPSNANEFAHA